MHLSGPILSAYGALTNICCSNECVVTNSVQYMLTIIMEYLTQCTDWLLNVF